MAVITPSFIAAGVPSATTGITIAPEYPTAAQGVQAGDTFVMHVVGQGRTTNIPAITVPAGWTALYTADGTTNQVKQWILIQTAKATGSDSGGVSALVSTPGTGGVIAAVIYAFRGILATGFVEDADITNGLSATVAAPSVTAGPTRLCCAFVGIGGNQVPPAFAGETGGNWTVATQTSGVTGDGYGIQLQTAPVSNATISGGTAAITSDNWVVRAFALISVPVTLFDDGFAFDDGFGWIEDIGANALVSRAPLLASPTVGQKHKLTAANLADVASSLPHPIASQLSAPLTATSLVSRAPTLGQPVAVIKRNLIATSLTDAASSLPHPAVGQKHALAATSLNDRAPLLGQPAAKLVYALAANALAARAPIVGSPALGVIRNLVATSLADAASILGHPTAARIHNVAAASLVSRPPVLGQPIPALQPTITALPLTSRSPLLGSPVVGQKHALTATALSDAAPVLASPTPHQKHALAASALAAAAPVLGTPGQLQAHGLTASALAAGAPVIGHPFVGHRYALSAAALSGSAASATAAGVGQKHSLAANGVSARPTLGQPAAGQKHALAAGSLADGAAILGHPSAESFLPGTFAANSFAASIVRFDRPRLNWRDIAAIRIVAANAQAKVDTYGARPAYASAGAGTSSAAQLGVLAPLAPADVQPGDLLFWVAACLDSDFSSNVAAPTGYVALTGSPFGTNTTPYAPRTHIALKPATGAEAGVAQSFSYALVSGDASRRSISARVYRVTAADGFAAHLVEGVAVSEGITSGAASIAAPAVAPSGVNRLGLIVTILDDDTGDVSSAGGIWQQTLPEHKNTIGGDCTIDLQWAALAREPSTDVHIPYGAVGDIWVSVGFALAPARTSVDVASAGVLIEDLAPVLATAVNM